MEQPAHPYQHFVAEFARVAREARACPMGGFASKSRVEPKADAPKALLFSPHPDDEAIVGGLALRLMRECGWIIGNVAVTLGSKVERRAGRLEELQAACGFLGFELLVSGFWKVTLSTRRTEPERWKAMVAIVTLLLQQHQPKAIFFPHEQDWNSAHIGTHFLVMDALAQAAGLDCFLVETEYWGQMASPNLMVEYDPREVADLVAAVSFHVGEMKRNPFHLGLPAWMHDNVRRGGELVGGQGEAAPDYVFAQLLRLSRWRMGRVEDCYSGGRSLPASAKADTVFGEAASDQ